MAAAAELAGLLGFNRALAAARGPGAKVRFVPATEVIESPPMMGCHSRIAAHNPVPTGVDPCDTWPVLGPRRHFPLVADVFGRLSHRPAQPAFTLCQIAQEYRCRRGVRSGNPRCRWHRLQNCRRNTVTDRSDVRQKDQSRRTDRLRPMRLHGLGGHRRAGGGCDHHSECPHEHPCHAKSVAPDGRSCNRKERAGECKWGI